MFHIVSYSKNSQGICCVGHNNNTVVYMNMDYCVFFQQASDFYKKLSGKIGTRGFPDQFISFFRGSFEKFVTMGSFT
jgi:hypothetical protein